MAASYALLLLLVFLVVLIPLGIALAIRGFSGTPALSEPKCARCGYDLRGFTGAPPTRCSECGSDLTVAAAVRWGDYRRRPGLIWTGIALVLLPLLLVFGLMFARVRSSPYSTTRSN